MSATKDQLQVRGTSHSVQVPVILSPVGGREVAEKTVSVRPSGRKANLVQALSTVADALGHRKPHAPDLARLKPVSKPLGRE